MPTPWMLGNTGPMADDSRLRGRASGLTDRRGECGVLDQLINTVRAGGSGVLVVLVLVSEVAGERLLVCVVDDEQWLDRASVQALGFAARRLAADPVGLVFAVRVAGGELARLPELAVAGLRAEDARVLLDSVLAGPVDARVRDLIVAETR